MGQSRPVRGVFPGSSYRLPDGAALPAQLNGFELGTTSPVYIVGTKIERTRRSQLMVSVLDRCGNVTVGDPEFLDVEAGAEYVLTDVHPNDRVVLVANGTPALTRLEVVVNGTLFDIDLVGQAEVRFEIAAAMRPADNTIVLRGHGPAGASAAVTIADYVHA